MWYRIVICYEDDEHLPIFTTLGHNLKEKNIFCCQFEETTENNNDMTHRAVFYENTNKDGEKIMEMFTTYSNKQFVEGSLKIRENEYNILDYKQYVSLQIGEYCYDNIIGIRLPASFALERGNFGEYK